MVKKVIICVITFLLAMTPKSLVYAGTAVLLTDYELDQIYAAGLNLNFDGFLGNMDSVTGSVPQSVSGTTSVSDSSVIVNPVEQLAKLSPTHVKSPVVPVSPNQPTAPIHPDQPMSSVPASIPAEPAVAASPAVPATPVTPMVPAISSGNANIDILLDQTVSSNETTIDPIPVFELAGISSPVAPSDPVAPVSPTTPVTPTVPQAPLNFESFAANNGKIEVMAFESLGNVDAVELNSLNVTDTAQQYLNSVNNVNAAGSTVLIQQNLVILINSKVENLNNFNDLNLQSYVPIP